VIRRGFWFAAGAVAGIAGYRRASRAVRTLLPQADLLAPLGRGSGPSRAGASRRGSNRKRIAGTAAFVRDVRTGMADYLDHHRDI
jgi:hypothetical protein